MHELFKGDQTKHCEQYIKYPYPRLKQRIPKKKTLPHSQRHQQKTKWPLRKSPALEAAEETFLNGPNPLLFAVVGRQTDGRTDGWIYGQMD